MVIVGIIGARVGEVRNVRLHPQGTRIWLADVALEKGVHTIQIVFGGDRILRVGELVPVAPPGSWAIMRPPGIGVRRKKMRARNYRGQRSHGMLCSLVELGWIHHGPNEVAILRDLPPGDSLDDLPRRKRSSHVKDWERAASIENIGRTILTEMFDPAAEPCGIAGG